MSDKGSNCVVFLVDLSHNLRVRGHGGVCLSQQWRTLSETLDTKIVCRDHSEITEFKPFVTLSELPYVHRRRLQGLSTQSSNRRVSLVGPRNFRDGGTTVEVFKSELTRPHVGPESPKISEESTRTMRQSCAQRRNLGLTHTKDTEVVRRRWW